MTRRLCLLVLILFSNILLGCNQSIYYWGNYEKSVYRMYHSKNFSPAKEIVILKKQIEKADQSKKLVGPGINAHLGYLYSLQGDPVAAAKAFNAEKEAFPESRIMMNRFLKNLP